MVARLGDERQGTLAWADDAASVSGISEALANAVLAAALADPTFASAFDAAVRALAERLAPTSQDGRPVPLSDAARALTLRFGDALDEWFEPAWLYHTPRVTNAPRREHFVRLWAWYAGVGLRTPKGTERDEQSARALLAADPRRVALTEEDRSLQDRIEAEAARRIAAEVTRRAEEAKAYPSGRRE